jgi:catechol 2,3-dioxygenase-like lactoylglutathione lyase family enzyme
MAKVIFGNHAAARVPLTARDAIRAFYCDLLGGELVRAGEWKDDVCLGGSFHIAFLYEDESAALPEADFRRAIYLEIQADNAEEMRQRIVDFGVNVLDVPDDHLYFQAPGGQVLRLVGIGEDLAKYEGTSHGEDNVGRPFGLRTANSG